jgi:hypothetical protein
LKSHPEDGSGVEVAADISTLGGRAPRPGRPACWMQHGGACEDEALGLEAEELVNGELARSSKPAGNRWAVGGKPGAAFLQAGRKMGCGLGPSAATYQLPKPISLVQDVCISYSHSEVEQASLWMDS